MIHTLRLTSGLIIFSFVCCHLINHIFGLISIEAMETARGYLLGFWRTVPGMTVFGLAGVIHVSIAVRSIYIRRTLRLPPWEWAQILLGLAIPFFLIILRSVLFGDVKNTLTRGYRKRILILKY